MSPTIASMLISTLLSVLPTRLGNPYKEVIRVRDQVAFDSLQTSVDRAVENGMKKINVKISKGTYYFAENHLDIRGVDNPELEITVEANKSVFVPKGATYRMVYGSAPYESEFAENLSFADTELLEDVEMRSAVCQAASQVGRYGNMYRMKVREGDVPDTLAKDMYLVLSQWYASGVHKVEKIEGGWLYFTSTYSFSQITRDEYYGKKYPKYILVNAPSPAHPSVYKGRVFYSGSVLHQGEATRFLTLKDCSIKSFTLGGAHFLGNRGNGPLLDFEAVSSGKVEVAGCSFTGLHGRVADCKATDNFSFSDNEVTRCFLDGVTVDGASSHALISGNIFSDNGQRMTQSFDVVMRGRDFLVKDNLFVDFCYSGLGIGYHFQSGGGIVTSGTVEDNEFCHSDRFRAAKVTRTLMDSGAIYIWTMNEDVVIRNNYIHDITGAKDNRGIFGDDGAFNVRVYGNLIVGIENSFTIDFRRVANVETRSDSDVDKVNYNILMYGNTVDGRVRFQPRPGDEGSYKGDNILVSPRENREELVRRWRKGKTSRNSHIGVGEDL